MFENKRQLLLANLDVAYAAYHKAEVFGGPSLYFHQEALSAGRRGDLVAFTEKVYAVLTAWGMHRMGQGGSKMCDYAEFKKSLAQVWPAIQELQKLTVTELTTSSWCQLRDVFCRIRCMSSRISLVGNSKVMAHALPNLVAPVDREYTLTFLYGHGRITCDLEQEWRTLKQILQEFFHPLLSSELFGSKLQQWTQPAPRPWDSSPLKILDNLVIGWMKYTRESSPAEAAALAVDQQSVTQ